MPKGKHRFTLEEDRIARAVAKGYQAKGFLRKKAMGIGYAVVARLRAR